SIRSLLFLFMLLLSLFSFLFPYTTLFRSYCFFIRYIVYLNDKILRRVYMYLKTFVDEKLAQNAYLVGCQRTGEAIIIDPPRYYEHIIVDAAKEGLTITAAAETHIHADYVSGEHQLEVKENVKLYLSDEGDKDWKYQYGEGLNTELIKEGSKINIGKVELDVIHTPGHTPESLSFILTDYGGGATEPMGIFTGDFVFVGDVGRPDLLEEAAGVVGTSVIGARDMFHSVQ